MQRCGTPSSPASTRLGWHSSASKDRWESFIDGREFESYNDPKLNRLVLAFRLCGIGYWAAFAVAVASIIYVCWWT